MTGLLDRILAWLADNSPVFKKGDTFAIGGGYYFGMTSGAGTAFVCTVFTPKLIPSNLTLTASGKFDSVRTQAGVVKTQIPVYAVNRVSENAITLQGNVSGLGSYQLCNAVPTGITISFS